MLPILDHIIAVIVPLSGHLQGNTDLGRYIGIKVDDPAQQKCTGTSCPIGRNCLCCSMTGIFHFHPKLTHTRFTEV